jgi:citrate synthase
MFAIPRTSGWVAQWTEMLDDDDTKIARPRQIYTGARSREYQRIGERESRTDKPSSETSGIDPTKG